MTRAFISSTPDWPLPTKARAHVCVVRTCVLASTRAAKHECVYACVCRRLGQLALEEEGERTNIPQNHRTPTSPPTSPHHHHGILPSPMAVSNTLALIRHHDEFGWWKKWIYWGPPRAAQRATPWTRLDAPSGWKHPRRHLESCGTGGWWVFTPLINSVTQLATFVHILVVKVLGAGRAKHHHLPENVNYYLIGSK